MRKYAILVSVVVVMACRAGGAQKDSVARDTTTVTPTPPVAVTPTADSVASRPRTTKTPPSADARKSPAPSKITSGTTKTDVPPPPPPTGTSVRGIVSVVGTSRDRRVTVAAATGPRTTITGPLAPLIGHLAGADVSVDGVSSGTSLEAQRFLVKTVDGQPAIDGTLKTDGGALYIVTADGTRTRIVAPPPSFSGRDGARVWITGDPSRGVASFGFIDPPR